MRYALALTERAEADIANAVKWYEAQRKGLGVQFSANLDAAYSLLIAMPRLGGLRHRDVRRLRLRRFPYAIYYRIIDQLIEIRACLHLRRRASAWRRR